MANMKQMYAMPGLAGFAPSIPLDPRVVAIIQNQVSANKPSAFDEALREYPVLRSLNLSFKHSPGRSGEALEFWRPGEPGTTARPRPNDIPLDVPGIETFGANVRPIDIMGDVASHYLMQTDSKMSQYYGDFKRSLTPEQKETLKGQYEYSKKNFGEERPYKDWEEASGLPAYFRGYAFKQWDNAEEMYTPEQISMFDRMMAYLRGQ